MNLKILLKAFCLFAILTTVNNKSFSATYKPSNNPSRDEEFKDGSYSSYNRKNNMGAGNSRFEMNQFGNLLTGMNQRQNETLAQEYNYQNLSNNQFNNSYMGHPNLFQAYGQGMNFPSYRQGMNFNDDAKAKYQFEQFQRQGGHNPNGDFFVPPVGQVGAYNQSQNKDEYIDSEGHEGENGYQDYIRENQYSGDMIPKGKQRLESRSDKINEYTDSQGQEDPDSQGPKNTKKKDKTSSVDYLNQYKYNIITGLVVTVGGGLGLGYYATSSHPTTKKVSNVENHDNNEEAIFSDQER
jgi:hypothetical protein